MFVPSRYCVTENRTEDPFFTVAAREVELSPKDGCRPPCFVVRRTRFYIGQVLVFESR
jgi:hypothetical protein